MDFWGTTTAAKAAPLATGTYKAVVKKAAVEKTTQGADRVSVLYEVKSPAENNGATVWANYNIGHPVGKEILRKSLDKVGLDTTKVKSLDELNALVGELTLKTVEVYVECRTYTGRDGAEKTAHNVYINGPTELSFGNLPPALDVEGFGV
jgi:hypothetical protein